VTFNLHPRTPALSTGSCCFICPGRGGPEFTVLEEIWAHLKFSLYMLSAFSGEVVGIWAGVEKAKQ